MNLRPEMIADNKEPSQIDSGILYWITGLAGAGKSTIGTEVYRLLKKEKSNIIYLDGDILRSVFGVKGAYSIEERKNLAFQYARLGKVITDQGVDVVCATISLFRKVQQWNRENIPNYKEIYIRVPIEILIKRDQKRLYSRALNGEIRDVMGVDLPVYEPESPNLIIDNEGSVSPHELAERIVTFFSPLPSP